MKKSAIILLCFWTLITGIFIALQEYTLKTGREILLETTPVDPRDLFRGDYVILNYEIAQYYLAEDYLSKHKINDIVYVELNIKPNNIATMKGISNRKPNNKLYLKGQIKNCNTSIPLYRSHEKCINYGIESYFVKEGTGKKLEKDLSNGALVKVLVDKNGTAKIKGFSYKKNLK